ncbi:MAG: glycoside hydrolase family 3 [Candidatus Marinimicrobia bacterium CG08_land_8_20_14_0_20_45_22]|nr:MAG: glycoside hydrolase family 3 [Candidatus Marinimicrobia bacterium CG08_land_8_20_14_0_20_45_22]
MKNQLIRIVCIFSFLFFIYNIAVGKPTFREKIGQMVMIGFAGTTVPDSLAYDLNMRNLGGVLLFGSNCQNPTQIADLTESIKSLAETPPLIAIDQEGGRVARLGAYNGFSSTPSAFQLGSTYNLEDSTRQTAARMAGWLSTCGINVNLAPVVDVNVNRQSPAIGAKDRSFSSDPMTVARHASWFIDEFHQREILMALKHFPGHGSAEDDSHLGFTDISQTWTSSELTPYEELFSQGFDDMVMVGHLFNSNIDSVYPASLSRNAISGLLRDSLGYGGVVISDELFMRAITDTFSLKETVTLAVNAGMDILLFNTNLYDGRSLTAVVSDIIIEQIRDDVIDSARIEESFQRIMALKERSNGVVKKILPTTPDRYELDVYPNPFNAQSFVSFAVPRFGRVKLSIYNLLGQKVSSLMDANMIPGNYRQQIDAGNLASGVYFITLETPERLFSRLITVVK